METKHPGGRPLKFESVEYLQLEIERYFEHCEKEYDTRKFEHDELVPDDNGKMVCCRCEKPKWKKGCIHVEGEKKDKEPPTIVGLALWLDTCRQTLLNYEEKPEFVDTIKRAKMRVEASVERNMLMGKSPPAPSIFWLTNNGDGWVNKQDTSIRFPKDGAADLAGKLFEDATGDAPAEAD